MVELGAGTMLPSLTVALNYFGSTVIAADIPSLYDQLNECHELNGKPDNLIPLSFQWGSKGNSLRDLEKLVVKLEV